MVAEVKFGLRSVVKIYKEKCVNLLTYLKLVVINLALLLTILFAAPAFSEISENHNGYHLHKLSSKEFFGAYGFLLGQKATVGRIEDKYPDHIMMGKLKFDAAFSKILEKMETIAKRYVQREVLKQFEIETLKPFNKHLDNLVIDPQFAKTFDEELTSRARGNIESPFLQTFLAVQYFDNPVEEIWSGFKQSYSSRGHEKSKGVNVTFEVPKSWKGRSGKRPNTLMQWTSQNGWGLDIVNVLINDLGYKPSLNEIQAYAKDKAQLGQSLIAGMELVDSDVSYIENQPYVSLESEGIINRAGVELQSYQMQLQIFYRDKIVIFTCFSNPNRKIPIKLLCNQILNSVVFPDLY